MKTMVRPLNGLILLISAVLGGCWIYTEVIRGVKVAYFEWGTVDIIRNYMKNHDGKVPKSWDDLAPYYKREGHVHGSSSFSELKETFKINFECLAQIAENRGGNCVIVQRMCGGFHFEWIDANAELQSAVFESVKVHLKTNAPSVNDIPPKR